MRRSDSQEDMELRYAFLEIGKIFGTADTSYRPTQLSSTADPGHLDLFQADRLGAADLGIAVRPPVPDSAEKCTDVRI